MSDCFSYGINAALQLGPISRFTADNTAAERNSTEKKGIDVVQLQLSIGNTVEKSPALFLELFCQVEGFDDPVQWFRPVIAYSDGSYLWPVSWVVPSSHALNRVSCHQAIAKDSLEQLLQATRSVSERYNTWWVLLIVTWGQICKRRSYLPTYQKQLKLESTFQTQSHLETNFCM